MSLPLSIGWIFIIEWNGPPEFKVGVQKLSLTERILLNQGRSGRNQIDEVFRFWIECHD